MKYKLKIRDSFGNLLDILQEIPDKGDKFPTVVMVPGFGIDLHEYGFFDDISDLLVKNGMQTFRFSFEGTGSSEGKFVDMTMKKQVQQLSSILDYVYKDRFTDKNKIGLLGQSFGSSTIMASLPIVKAKSIIFMSVGIDPGLSLAKYFKRDRGFEPDGVSKVQRSDGTYTTIGSQFWKSIAKYNFVAQIKKATQPVLLIHGRKDRKVKLSEAQELYVSIKSKKRLVVIKKADHAFTGKFRKLVFEQIVDWFDKTLI